MLRVQRTRRLPCPLVAITTASCVVALAACGSSGTPGAASNRGASGIRFSDCMRAHGVPNFPDPGSGGGVQITAGSGINPQAPAFQAAQSVCAKLMPGGGPPRGPASETRKLAMLRLARCMRAHGVTAFPDPTSTPPSAPPAGGGIAFGGQGSFLAVPQSLIRSPEFKQAATVCSFPGVGHGGPKAAQASAF